MGNSSAKIVVDPRAVKLRLEHMVRAASDWSPVTDVLSHKLRNSVVENFDVGGRYDRAGSFMGGTKKWEPKKDGSASFLQESGLLRGSILPEHDADTSTVSTNMEYAAANNFGVLLGARSSLMTRTSKKKGGTPPRPYMVVQKETVEEAKHLGRDHLLGKGL